MRRDVAEYRIGTKSDSYIFAIEKNSIPISLKGGGNDDYLTIEKCDNQQLLIIPTKKLIAPDEIEFYRANWRRFRWFLYSLFWFSWILSVIFAVMLAASHPKCVVSIREWWKDSVIYEIWTLSYNDLDGNGIGDLAGIKVRLEKLRKLGIGALFLRPIIKVEKSGMGVIGHTKLSSQIGSMEDFDEFVKAAHDKDIRILIDFPLVVTSIAHPWFDRSALASRPENSNFANFYYWRRGISNSEYISAYKNSMLKYFHVKSRPDLPILAWQNAGNVSDAIKAALSFWIGKGVDGFHFSSIDYLHRSPDGLQPDWEQIAKILKSIRAHVHGEMTKTNNKIFLFTSHEHLSERTKRLLTKDSLAVDAVVHTEMRKLAIGNKICSKEEASIAECANEIVADLLFFHQHSAGNDEKNWPIWSFGSPFCPRLAKRVGSRAVGELLVLLELILPGTPLVYFGEEVGREDEIIQQNCNKLKHQNVQIPLIQSNGTKIENFDFSIDLMRTFRRMVRLRRHSKTMANGQTYITKPIDQQSFALCRYLKREEDEENQGIGSTNNGIYGEVLIYAANFGSVDQTISFADLPPFHLPTNPFKKGKIVARSINALTTFGINSFVDLSQRKIELGPVQAVIIKASADFY